MYPGCSQCSGEAWCPDLVATRGCLLPLWDLASPFFFVVVRKQMGGVARALLLLPSWVNVERTQKTVPVWIGSDQSAAHKCCKRERVGQGSQCQAASSSSRAPMDSLLQQRHDVGEVDVEPIVEGEGDRRLFAAEERHHSGYSRTSINPAKV